MAALDEIPDGGRKVVDVAGRSIGVFNVGGRYFALRNRCPHQGGPLCLGRTTGLVYSEGPGHYTLEREGEIIRCPWHGWQFDMTTGRSVLDPHGTRVATYPVEVAPLTAETYAVEVAGRAVVVLI